MRGFAFAVGTLAVAATVAVGCGGGGALNQQELVSAADEICSENLAAYETLGVRGFTNAGIAAEMAGTARVAEEGLDSLEDLEVESSVPAAWNTYLTAVRQMAATDRRIVRAAKAEDDAGVSAGFAKLDRLFAERRKAAEALGLKSCGRPAEIELEKTGTGPAEELVTVEPSDDVDAAAEAWIAAIKSGSCGAINGMIHTDGGAYTAEQCATATDGYRNAKVVASEQYGPVGMAEIVADGVHWPTLFVVDIRDDRRMRKVVDTINDSGGLRPAAEGNDADEIAKATVEAIREGDAEAFNRAADDPNGNGSFIVEEGFTTIGAGPYSKGFVESIRSGDAEPELLGINATFAVYQIDGEQYDYALVLVHTPGDGNSYRVTGLYPMPRP